MRAVILLVCLVLVQISWSEADTEVSSNDVREVLDRNAREVKGKKQKQQREKNTKKSRKGKKNNAKKFRKGKKNNAKKSRKGKKKDEKKSRKGKQKNSKKSRKGKKKNGKGNTSRNKSKNSKPRNANGKNKGRKDGKKNQKKSETGRSKVKNKKFKVKISKKGKKNKNKILPFVPAPVLRQSDSECFATLCEKSKKFNLYQTQLRKAKRTKAWVKQMDSKKVKAATTFKNASTAIVASTLNGTQCDGGPINDETKTANEKLPKCDVTASEKCSSSKIDGLKVTLIDDCEPKLQAYVDQYKVCLKTCECSCFTALALVDATCTKFNTMESNTKAAKNKCTKSDTEGSFGDCRKQERLVAYYGYKCKYCFTPTPMSTKAPGARQLFLAQMQQRLKRRAGRL